MLYFDELTKAMTWLGEQPDTVFIGQSVAYTGNAMFKTLRGVPLEKRVELPVAEEMQLGLSIGMALTGMTVISIYPRFDFLLLAVNQLCNHLDKLEEFTHGQYHAKVIIRVGIGATSPLYPGVQHCGDYTEAFRMLLPHIPVYKIETANDVFMTYKYVYQKNLEYHRSSLIVEDMSLYEK